MPTATQVKTESFYSKGRNERLVRRAQGDPITTPSGVPIQQAPPVRYEFAPDGRLDVRAGQDRLQDGPYDEQTGEPGWQDAVAWLTSHREFNVRFWHEGHEPDRALPTETDFMAVITTASIDLDAAAVQAALEQETGSHNRPVLVATATLALDKIMRTLDEIASERAKADAREAERTAKLHHEGGLPLPDDADDAAEGERAPRKRAPRKAG